MKKLVSSLSLLVIGCQIVAQTGTWTKVVTNAPHTNYGVMIQLTDGTVICHNSNGGGSGTGWDKLTPNASGSYVNGTWTSIASMHYDRLFFATQVLPDGKVFAAGGEYGAGATRGEVYDPVANTWTLTGTVTGNQNIYDGNSEILPDGRILVGVQNGNNPSFDNLYYTESTNAWTTAPSNVSPYNHDEAEWLKLPDSSILFVGIASINSVRYRPQTSTWVNDGNLPISLYDNYGEEAGAAFMLPNGKAVFFGATGQNAIYTPTGTTVAGSWAQAQSFPTIRGSLVGQTDAPACMMVNGHILLACSPIGTASNEFQNPIYFVEYNYLTNTFTQVRSNIPGTGVGGDSIPGNSCYQDNMLQLPDGNVLMSVDQAGTVSSEYWVYTPGSAAIANGKPTINSILPDACPTYKITGKLFNGISEGAAYGDDWQTSTNWPLVRLTNGTNVYYAKTTHWNRIGAVQTDSLEDTALFTLPTIPAGTYSLYVVVNGFASSPVLFTVFGIASVSQNNISCGSTVGSASVNIVGTFSPYTYSWNPGGATTATASNLTAGVYTVTVRDNNGCVATAAFTITQANGFNLAANITNISCNGNANGVASAGISGGTSPYTYSWSGGRGSSSAISGLSAGTYTITVTDACGSSETASATITQPAVFATGIGSQTNASCTGGAGSVTASNTGGTSPYTYAWSGGGGSNATASNLSAGTYSVLVTDNRGCTSTTAATITQPATGPSISIANVTNSLCNGSTSGSITANAASGGTAPYTYTWTGGGGTNVTTVALSAGSYTVTVTDNHGCTFTASAVITQPDALGTGISSIAYPTCNGGTGSVTANAATGGTSPYSYTWSDGGTNLTDIVSAGTYTITATDNNGCQSTLPVTITQPTQVGVSIASQTNVTCNASGSAIANAATGGTSPYLYSWSSGAGTDLSASNLSAGSYTITASDNNGCIANATVTITQSAGSVGLSIASQTDVTCFGGLNGSATVNAATGGTAPYTYSWSTGGTDVTVSNLGAGTYNISVTDNIGCTSSASVTVTQPAELTLAGDSTFDDGSCNGSAWIITNGGTAPYTYSWTGGFTTDTITSQCTGSYCGTVTDANGCSESICVTVKTSTGISKLNGDNGQIIIYPNPNNGIFTVSLSHAELVSASQTSIEVYNVLGEKVYFETLKPVRTVQPGGQVQGDNSINLSNQPDGVYFYRLLKDNGNLLGAGKLIIQK